MHTEPDPNPDSDDIVEHKVRRRVAKKVMRDIHHQVDEIEQQVADEKKASRLLLPIALALLLVVMMLIWWPLIPRLLSALIDAG